MNNLQRHSILFDAPVGNNPIYLGQGNMIENINVIYNPKIIRAFLQSYMVVLIFQYIACFSSAPFDNVENRPSISVLSSIYSLFMVCSNLQFLISCFNGFSNFYKPVLYMCLSFALCVFNNPQHCFLQISYHISNLTVCGLHTFTCFGHKMLKRWQNVPV